MRGGVSSKGAVLAAGQRAPSPAGVVVQKGLLASPPPPTFNFPPTLDKLLQSLHPLKPNCAFLSWRNSPSSHRRSAPRTCKRFRMPVQAPRAKVPASQTPQPSRRSTSGSSPPPVHPLRVQAPSRCVGRACVDGQGLGRGADETGHPGRHPAFASPLNRLKKAVFFFWQAIASCI